MHELLRHTELRKNLTCVRWQLCFYIFNAMWQFTYHYYFLWDSRLGACQQFVGRLRERNYRVNGVILHQKAIIFHITQTVPICMKYGNNNHINWNSERAKHFLSPKDKVRFGFKTVSWIPTVIFPVNFYYILDFDNITHRLFSNFIINV
jgi:hypothetical protein